MERDEKLIGLMRRLEAHRWIMLAIITAANAKGSLNIEDLIADLETLGKEMSKKNEASELMVEFREMTRLVKGLIPSEPGRGS